MNNKTFLILIAIISIALLSYPANAESGTIPLLNSTDYTFTPSGTSAATVIDYTKLWVYSSQYSDISQYTMFLNTGAGFLHPSNSTTFTITSGGTGSGFVSYNAYGAYIQWQFFDTTITGNPIVMSYAQNIFDDSNFPKDALYYNAAGGAVSSTQPACIGTLGSCIYRIHNAATTVVVNSHEAQMGSLTSVGYNIQYIGSFYNGTFTKSGIPTNKITLQNNTAIQFAETTFNNVSFNSPFIPYTTGIYLNLSMAGGQKTVILINSSGISTNIPNTSNPSSANCPVNCIETSKPTYNNTETANIFGSFYPATTTQADCLFFGFFCTNTTISTESNTGYVFISTQGSTSPIQFLSFTKDLNNNFNLFTNLDIGTYQAQLYGFAAPGTTCTNGIVYDFPFIPLGCYYPHNITTFSVVNNSGNLSIHWQTKLSNSSAIYGDTITVAWQNVTANDTVVIYDQDGAIAQSYNINLSTVKQIPVFIPLYTIGVWNATIYNSTNHDLNVSAYLNVLPPGSVDVNNSYGITMYWSKAADIVDNPTTLNWNTGTYSGYYNISILKNGAEVRRAAYTGVPGQQQQASYSFESTGAYIAEFIDRNETIQAQADIQISTSTSGGIVVTPAPTGSSLVGSSSLVMNTPWIGLMLLIVVIFGLIKNGVESGTFVFAVAITTSLEALFGLWENWGIYITILSWLLVAVFFKVNKSIEA